MFPSSLIDVIEKHNFNLNNLNLWLEKNLTSFGKIGLIKQFFGGQSNPTFFLSSDHGEKLILRKNLRANFYHQHMQLKENTRCKKLYTTQVFHVQK